LQIVYYGCPAEEEGAGKCKMIKKGMFENIDACFT
jgi:metal-dependent amidase/aminoacylase/carboxypeptidase family protein